MLKLDFTNETKIKVDKTLFEKRIKKFYKVLKKLVDGRLYGRNGLIDLVIINDKAMHEMNREYRKKDSPTDVISFAYLEITEYKKKKGDVIAGDIFISIDTAKKQAKEKGHTVSKEMEVLFVHALLHCFGFDHENDRQETEMEGWAKKVLEN
ncbi:rRNA maturation RNase YbeY [Candidatus Peregrinibacteria bacterium]|nr:rRNA maturation RNase YbeY [Candidatus Peregrinibacteria bacterium]